VVAPTCKNLDIMTNIGGQNPVQDEPLPTRTLLEVSTLIFT
jgi:hypothetical protein